jgi:hypothetical protein
MRQGASGFYYCIPSLPQHVSANGCHLQEVVGAFEANQAGSGLWADTDYDPSSVARCRGTTGHTVWLRALCAGYMCIMYRLFDLYFKYLERIQEAP